MSNSEFVLCLAQGLTVNQIAKQKSIDPIDLYRKLKTVKAQAFAKTQAQVVAIYLIKGIIKPEQVSSI